jgi:hypothetical protein
MATSKDNKTDMAAIQPKDEPKTKPRTEPEEEHNQEPETSRTYAPVYIGPRNEYMLKCLEDPHNENKHWKERMLATGVPKSFFKG